MSATLVRTTSHRSRDRMERVVAGLVPYFSWARAGEFYYVPAESLDAVLAIKGITRARKPADLAKCWDWS